MMNKERAIFVKKTDCKVQLIQGMENCTLKVKDFANSAAKGQ